MPETTNLSVNLAVDHEQPVFPPRQAQYLIWSNQHQRWWGPGRHGYTAFVEEAGRYSLTQARSIVAQATMDGCLREVHRGYIYPQPLVNTSPEVLMLAPESLAELLDHTTTALTLTNVDFRDAHVHVPAED